MNIFQVPSPNYDKVDAKGNDWRIVPRMIVIHWTAGSYESALKWLCNPQSKVSAHYVVDHEGNKISQLVDLDRRAWHCGGSYHPLLQNDTNADTIGIEFEGPPSSIGKPEWDSTAIHWLAMLCEFVAQGIPSIKGIVDHSTIDPRHKMDVKGGTGMDKFPWQTLVDLCGLEDYTIYGYSAMIKKHFGM